MSADAKIYLDSDDQRSGGWIGWRGLHDRPEGETCWAHTQGGTLAQTLEAVEKCTGSLRWEFRVYPDGQVGLVGFHA